MYPVKMQTSLQVQDQVLFSALKGELINYGFFMRTENSDQPGQMHLKKHFKKENDFHFNSLRHQGLISVVQKY